MINNVNYKKNIYIAYTGGTIGMAKSDKGFVPKENFLTQSIMGLSELQRPEMPAFEIVEYDTLFDSSDMQPWHWQTIANDIFAKYNDYDGFIILHGTDTMAYTASALSFMFDHLTKPIIITGSQIPLAEIRSDGQDNLLNALYLAAHYPLPEVGVFFNNHLYRGNRARKLNAQGFDAFSSPNFPALINAGIAVTVNENALHQHATLPTSLAQIQAQPISMLTLYPGIDAKIIDNMLQAPAKALVLQSFGVGNAPQREALKQLFADAIKRNIIIVNCSQCTVGRVDMQGYANGHWMHELGVISGGDMTPEAVLTKLHYVLSISDDYAEQCRLMQTNLRGELTLTNRA